MNCQKTKQTSAVSTKREASTYSPQHSAEMWFHFRKQNKQNSSAKKAGSKKLILGIQASLSEKQWLSVLAKRHLNFSVGIRIFGK